MAIRAAETFFAKNPIFGIERPKPFVFGRNPRIEGRAIFWFDHREHAVDVVSVVEANRNRLTVVDRAGRRFSFVPMTQAFYLANMTEMSTPEELAAVVDDESACEVVRKGGYGW
jgi:hypothetical protein